MWQVKTFLVLSPFEGALTCSILIAGKRFFLGEGPGLGSNPGLLGHGSKIPY
jgi:hypothetical protein